MDESVANWLGKYSDAITKEKIKVITAIGNEVLIFFVLSNKANNAPRMNSKKCVLKQAIAAVINNRA
ncbi:hypothetical protein BMR30_18435 [Escherichia coli]|nr:hypothetical protein BMR30_18435 [Escherichia coli]